MNAVKNERLPWSDSVDASAVPTLWHKGSFLTLYFMLISTILFTLNIRTRGHLNYYICPKIQTSQKHAYIILTPLNPTFFIVKLGFTGEYIIFLIFAKKHRLWYSLELPHQGSSNEYPQSIFLAETWKISEFFIWKFSGFFLGEIFDIQLTLVISTPLISILSLMSNWFLSPDYFPYVFIVFQLRVCRTTFMSTLRLSRPSFSVPEYIFHSFYYRVSRTRTMTKE